MQIVQKISLASSLLFVLANFSGANTGVAINSNATKNTTQSSQSSDKPSQSIAATKIDVAGTNFYITDDIPLSLKQVETYPESAEAYFNLAIAYSRTVEVEKALEAIRKTKSILKKSKDPNAVEKNFDKYISILKQNNSTNELVNYRLAFLHYLKAYLNERTKANEVKAKIAELKKQVEAEKSKTPVEQIDQAKITKLKSEKKSLKASLDTLHASPQNLELNRKAISYFDQVLSRNPKDVWTLSYKGYLIYNQFNSEENFQKAKKLWDQAIAIDSKNPAPHVLMGDALMKKGDMAGGFREITQALLLRAEVEATKNQKQ